MEDLEADHQNDGQTTLLRISGSCGGESHRTERSGGSNKRLIHNNGWIRAD